MKKLLKSKKSGKKSHISKASNNEASLRLTKVQLIKKGFNDRHPFVVPLVTIFCLIIFSGVSFLFLGGYDVKPTDSKVVSLYIDGKKQTVPTRASTVREMLERREIKITAEDVVEPSLDSPITNEQFSVNIYKAKPVTIIDESGRKEVVKIAETTPFLMATKAGFKVYPEDIIEVVEPDQSLSQGVIGTKVVIDRATLVKLNLYGTTFDVRTHAKTVADLAREKGVAFDDKSILPSPATAISENAVVFVTEPGKEIASVEEIINFSEEVINDQGLEAGKKQVRSEGTVGRKAVIYQVAADGSRKLLNEVIISQPVNRVVVQGRKVSSPNVAVSGDRASLMSAAGIASDQQASADFIVARESGWRPAARSAGGCIGLGQKCNATSLINACPNWETDPVCQLQHFNGYAVGRYGGWNQAYSFWTVNHWW